MGMCKLLGLKFVGWYPHLPDIYSACNSVRAFDIYLDIHIKSLRKKYSFIVEITNDREESIHYE